MKEDLVIVLHQRGRHLERFAGSERWVLVHTEPAFRRMIGDGPVEITGDAKDPAMLKRAYAYLIDLKRELDADKTIARLGLTSGFSIPKR